MIDGHPCPCDVVIADRVEPRDPAFGAADDDRWAIAGDRVEGPRWHSVTNEHEPFDLELKEFLDLASLDD